MIGRHTRFVINACIFSVGILTSAPSSSGVFTGYETDTENTRMVFVGSQTDGDIFMHFFAANLEYEFLDGNALTTVDNKILNVALGFRLGSNNNYSFLIGPSYNDKNEHTANQVTNIQSTGVFYQFGANANVADNHYEFLSSYSSLDSFIWARGRYKTQLNKSYSTGAEIFWMGNDDGDSWGSGLLLEYSGANANVGIKAGYKRSTNDESGSYLGLEFYFPL